MFLYNDPKFKSRRQELRKNQTDAEKFLWKNLRNKNLGYKFTRQFSFGPYILDFYCAEKRLAVELDGLQHLEDKEYDKQRDEYLLLNDIKVLRFWNSEVNANIESVLNKIRKETLN